jgi:hypothetical protein
MAIRQSVHTLSTSTAALLSPVGVHAGVDITIQNLSTDKYVYIGTSEVSTSVFGYRIDPGAAWSVELAGNESVYAVSSANGVQAAVFMLALESGN